MNNIEKLKIGLEYINGQILAHQLFCQYWLGMSSYQIANNNLSGAEMALDTAKNHIHLIQEMNDTRDGYLREIAGE
jgi:hypothetical protein